MCSRFLQTREIQAAAALEALETPNRAEDDSLGVVMTQTIVDAEPELNAMLMLKVARSRLLIFW